MRTAVYRVLAERFYKINTGFFLLFFVLLFGLLNGKATMELHHLIMQGITSSWVFCGGAMLVWTAYCFKCVSFVIRALNDPENSFLYGMQAMSNRALFTVLLLVHIIIMQPVLIYAGVTVAVGFRELHIVLPLVFVLFQVALCLGCAWLYYRKITGTWEQPILRLPSVDISRKKSYPFYLLHYSLHYRKRTFVAVKLCSLLALQIMVAANSNKVSKEAICVLIMFLISAHSLLPAYYVRFTEVGMPFLRNMPIPLRRRLGTYALTYSIIFLPELLFLLLNERHIMPVPLILSLYALAISQSLLYTGIQHIRNMQQERYSGLVFGIFFATLLLLASTNLWIVFTIEMIVATGLYIALYHSYEPEVKNE